MSARKRLANVMVNDYGQGTDKAYEQGCGQGPDKVSDKQRTRSPRTRQPCLDKSFFFLLNTVLNQKGCFRPELISGKFLSGSNHVEPCPQVRSEMRNLSQQRLVNALSKLFLKPGAKNSLKLGCFLICCGVRST